MGDATAIMLLLHAGHEHEPLQLQSRGPGQLGRTMWGSVPQIRRGARADDVCTKPTSSGVNQGEGNAFFQVAEHPYNASITKYDKWC